MFGKHEYGGQVKVEYAGFNRDPQFLSWLIPLTHNDRTVLLQRPSVPNNAPSSLICVVAGTEAVLSTIREGCRRRCRWKTRFGAEQ